ncbi:hypothetical protein BpHYR1_014383 [Brachionus plicatilis]|uniref:Uncharacterized protein n=1 Tax=Brachionus plicatilis TaxID=10195 RepID=A0A3M7RLM1_BRAPC|nr:hypothetical protein BpHYR1_014383 [Brachionus plicatilis]
MKFLNESKLKCLLQIICCGYLTLNAETLLKTFSFKNNLNKLHNLNWSFVFGSHVDSVIKCSQKKCDHWSNVQNKNAYYLCFLDICNLTPYSFFINSPHMLHATGFGCLLNAFFAANLAGSETSTDARAISL